MAYIQLEPNEHIIGHVHRYWYTLFVDASVFVVAGLIPLILFFILRLKIESVDYFMWLRLAYGIWILFLWIEMFLRITNHALDTWVITSKRLIDIDHRVLFHTKQTSIPLSEIGVMEIIPFMRLGKTFHAGTLRIRTTGTHGKYKTRTIANPEKIKEMILKAKEDLLNS